MNRFAIIFNWFPTTPVYHGFDNERLNERDSGYSTDFTRCGQVVSEYEYATGKYRAPGTWFPLKHALKFARPCDRCWPSPKDPQ